MCEDRVARGNYGIAEDARVRPDKGEEALIHEAEAEHIVWLSIFETLEQELGGELAEVDNGVAFFVARHLLPQFAVCALVVQSERGGGILKRRLVVVADISRHLVMVP